MNLVTKIKKHFKSQDDFDEFYSAWLKVLDSQSFGAYIDNLRDLKPLHTNAVKYVVNTWLVWREKIVRLPCPCSDTCICTDTLATGQVLG